MAFIIIGFALIACIDFIPLVRAREVRVMITFAGLFAVAFIFAVLFKASVKVPSIMVILHNLLKSIGLSY